MPRQLGGALIPAEYCHTPSFGDELGKRLVRCRRTAHCYRRSWPL